MHLDFPSNQWILWQLIDSAFPVGSFAHSGGIESAMQLGEVDGSEAVEEFVITSLHQCARSTCPFVIATAKNPDKYLNYDETYHVMLASTIPNKASRLQGQALLTTACKVWDAPTLNQAQLQIKSGFNSHLGIVFGLLASHHQISESEAVMMFLYLQARSILSAAVRLNIIGPIEAQRIQSRLNDVAPKISQIAFATSVQNAMQTAPVLDLLQAQHDRLYSRLFIT